MQKGLFKAICNALCDILYCALENHIWPRLTNDMLTCDFAIQRTFDMQIGVVVQNHHCFSVKKGVSEGKDPLVVMSSTDVVHLQEKCESCVPRDELGDDVVLAAT